MTDRPVVGQIGRTDWNETKKIEIVGQLRPEQWDEFVACLKECVKKHPGLAIRETSYPGIPILKKLVNKPPKP
jgi:hypothetical protein